MRNLHLKENLKCFYPDRLFRSIADEDQIVLDIFNNKHNGYAIDIGAADGISINNCFKLFNTPYEWSGLSIEPNPMFYPQLEYLFKDTNVQVCSSAIHQYETEVEFIQVLDETQSHMGHSNIMNRDTHMSHLKLKLPAKPINDILEQFNVPEYIDFISMDIEGAEEYVIPFWNFDKYKVKLWCIENGNQYQDILHEKGYNIYNHPNYNTKHGNVFFINLNL